MCVLECVNGKWYDKEHCQSSQYDVWRSENCIRHRKGEIMGIQIKSASPPSSRREGIYNAEMNKKKRVW
jgi:hypothetical protein